MTPLDVVDHQREHERTAVLRLLRRAGCRGVPYIAMRDQLNGENPNALLDELRALGFRIQRTPSDHGILAILLDPIGGNA